MESLFLLANSQAASAGHCADTVRKNIATCQSKGTVLGLFNLLQKLMSYMVSRLKIKPPAGTVLVRFEIKTVLSALGFQYGQYTAQVVLL